MKIFLVLRKIMKYEIESICSCVTTCSKEAEKLPNKLIFSVFIGIISICLVEHFVLIDKSEEIFFCELTIVKFFKLFINNFSSNSPADLYFLSQITSLFCQPIIVGKCSKY
jgi:hypothetical protein